MTLLDYEVVSRFWDKPTPSALSPYMMDGFGFPASAGRFRFRAESRIVQRLIHRVRRDGRVLDLGCGAGCWTEYFAKRFAGVVGVEASTPLFEVLEQRCAPYLNIELVHGDVTLFHSKDRYKVVFLGGMLMYLNEEDIIPLLQNLVPSLQPDGIILCRETTVRQGSVARQGEYQAVYRSVDVYNRIFMKCGLSVKKIQMNVPYVLMQMGCEFITEWKRLVATRLQFISVVGHLAYWGLRLGYPWITRVPTALGVAFPELTNHFFVLQPASQPTPNTSARDRAA